MKSAITPRPSSWVLERSLDGSNFQPWQFFGSSDSDCRSRYELPGQLDGYKFSSDSEVICSTNFSKLEPFQNAEVIVHPPVGNTREEIHRRLHSQIHLSLVKNRPGVNTSTNELLEFTLARYVRIRLQSMHTTLQSENNIQWMVDPVELKKRSFYSLRFIKIGARVSDSLMSLRNRIELNLLFLLKVIL